MILSPVRFPGLTLQCSIIHIEDECKWSYLRGTVQWQAGCPPVAWRCHHCAWIAPHGICRRSPSRRSPRWWCRPFPRWRSHRSFPVPVDKEGLRRTLGDVTKSQHVTGAFHGKVKLERQNIAVRFVPVNIVCPQKCLQWFDLCVPQ